MMGALTGTAAARAEAARAAGCDLALHCSGRLEDSEAVLDAAGILPDAVGARLRPPAAPQSLDETALLAERDRLLA
jgi:beta-N-acetylhexosaminidase